MLTWFHKGCDIHNRHFSFPVATTVSITLAERLVFLLNASEPGGTIERVIGAVEGKCPDAEAWIALGDLVRR